MNIDRGTANLDLLATWLSNKINKRYEHQIVNEVKQALRTCMTCEHFNVADETCGLTDNLRPPANIIAYGCDKYKFEYDDIPF